MINKIRRIDDYLSKGFYLFVAENGSSMILFKNGRTLFLDADITDVLIHTNLEHESSLMEKIKNVGKLEDDTFSEVLPTFFMIDFTTRCNMNCYYCLRDFNDEGYIISDDMLKKIVNWICDYCDENHIDHISIQPWGGEPLIAIDKIIEMRKMFIHRNIGTTITVQTNGLLLTEEMAHKLKENNINVGISIDGCAKIHDIHRKDCGGNNTYSKVKSAIAAAKRICDDDIGTITVNSAFSLDYLEESIESMVADLNLHTIKFNLMHPNSDAFDIGTVIKTSDIDSYIKRVFDKIIDLNEKGYQITDSNIRDKLLNILVGSSGDICHSRGCQGGRKFITIASNGDIFPCELVGKEEVKIGNIFNSIGLVNMIKESMLSNPYFSNKHSEKCDVCPWYVYCRGGCTASILSYNNNLDGIDEKECAVNQALYPRIIELVLERSPIISKLTKGRVTVGDN